MDASEAGRLLRLESLEPKMMLPLLASDMGGGNGSIPIEAVKLDTRFHTESCLIAG